MPDEGMDMAVDFGQAGFGEDIDIDLDFPTGQPDEDMDLEDFDRLHDIQNSDTRDELMAEGDDLSYGMIDAIEIDHNTSAAAANDIDIELGNTVESIWQQDSAPSASFNADAEIDYLDETIGENMDDERNDVQTSGWLQPATGSLDTDAMVHANSVSFDTLPGVLEMQGELPLEDSAVSGGESSGPLKTSQNDTEATIPPAAANLKESTQLSDTEAFPEDEIFEVEAQISAEEPSTTKQDEHNAGQPSAEADIKSLGPNSKFQESYELQEPDYPDDVIGTEHVHVDDPYASHESDRLENPESTEPINVNGDLLDLPQPEEAEEPADDLDASEYQLGGQSYIETANDQADADDDAPQAEAAEVRRSYSQPAESSPDRDLEGYNNKVAAAADAEIPTIGVGDRDDPTELADHYGVYITYGSTDYSLFAKSEDDDPNQYFLDDKSTLDISLAQFLASLREVISDEISPLDELVMNVDALGLEFSESTTLDFLGKFTFGDLVVLYDKLVKNEQAESSPPIYTYLTVRPNCNQRMRALGESANAGRGLSEVATYRDSSPMEEEQASNVGSPNTDFSVDGDYNDDDGQIYPQEDHEDGDILNDGGEQNSLPVTDRVRSGHSQEQNKEIDQLDNDNENFTDDSADAVNNEQDISISKQGISPFIFHYTFHCTQDSNCLCDDCYEVELQHIATPMRGRVWPVPGTVMPTHNTPTHMTWMTNRTMTEDHATSESSVLQPQEASEHGLQPSTKTAEDGESKLQAPGTSTNPSTDAPNSENTSVTATLDGEDQDEIDYDSDEDDAGNYDTDEAILQEHSSTATTDLKVPADDEITWESENEEAKTETKGASPRDTVQVSPVSGKRTRSDSDALDGAGSENDNKRRRS
ncbi:hypothetical protein HD806DRAFT_542774 [Xylariaceae sp. AK1471]|nr:hypothetical protein HD806DRAFT_542774 [Xylariaceae sp. AK1471]